MSEIRAIYSQEPSFPATAQHPDAVRYVVDGIFVDAIGGEPTTEEMDVLLNPPETGRIEAFEADADQRDLTNRLRNATPAQIDSWLDATVTSLPSAKAVLKAIVKLLVARRVF